jgi:hypothetical protein
MYWENYRLIPKADRKKIHEYLFREGVLVAKKDFNLPKHHEIDTKNLYVRFSPPTSSFRRLFFHIQLLIIEAYRSSRLASL